MIDHKYDVCVYELIEKTVIESEPYLENWFIMAPKGSKYIIDLYNEFERGRKMDYKIYKKIILKPSGVILKNTISDDDDNTYLMQHAIVNYLQKTGNKYKINKKDAYESFFKLHNLLSWNHEEVMNVFIKKDNWADYYALKFTSGQRNFIKNEEEFIKRLDSL